MKTTKLIIKSGVVFLLLATLFFNFRNTTTISFKTIETSKVLKTSKAIVVTKNVKIKNYFTYLDSVVESINKTENYNLTEHLFVRFNPWLIDSLAATDYYNMIEKDSFVYNQKERKTNNI